MCDAMLGKRLLLKMDGTLVVIVVVDRKPRPDLAGIDNDWIALCFWSCLVHRSSSSLYLLTANFYALLLFVGLKDRQRIDVKTKRAKRIAEETIVCRRDDTEEDRCRGAIEEDEGVKFQTDGEDAQSQSRRELLGASKKQCKARSCVPNKALE